MITTGTKGYFESLTVEFGEVYEDDVLPFSFSYKADTGEYHYQQPACGGCTEVWFNKETKKVEGNFRVSAAGTYTEPSTKVRKGITVYLDPEEHEFVADEKTKERKRNFRKRNIVLTLSATVLKRQD